GQSVGKTTLPHVRRCENASGFNVARIKFDNAALHRDRLIPMGESALDQADRLQHFNVVRKTLFRELEFGQCTAEVPRGIIAVVTKRKMSLSEIRIERDCMI